MNHGIATATETFCSQDNHAAEPILIANINRTLTSGQHTKPRGEMIVFNAPSCTVIKTVGAPPLRRGSWGAGRLHNSLKVTQLVQQTQDTVPVCPTSGNS